jgi:tetratricopeptide (TPR) repeat protein
LLLGFAVLFGVREHWFRAAIPAPPDVDLAGMEPPLAEAVRLARSRVLNRPRSAEAWGILGEVFLANEMEAESRVCFVEAERLNPRDPRWPYYQGGPLLNHGDPQSAVPFLRRAVDRCDPNDETGIATRLRLAEALLGISQAEEADAEIRKVLSRQPDNARAHFYLAAIAASHQDWNASRDHLHYCLDNPHCRQKARVSLAAVCLQQKEVKAAEQYRQQAERMPADAEWNDVYVAEYLQFAEKKRNRYRLAQELETTGRLHEAAGVLRPLTENYPDDYLPFLTLGKVLAQMGDFTEGERALRRSIELAPDRIQAHYYLSLLLFHKGETAARESREESARTMFEEAAVEARKALAVKPDYGYALMSLGLSLKHLGRRAEALAALYRAVECNPEYAELHLYLGETLAEDGQTSEARRHIEQAVLLSAPNDSRARAALARLPTPTKKDP